MFVPCQCAAWRNSILRWTSVCKTEEKLIALGFAMFCATWQTNISQIHFSFWSWSAGHNLTHTAISGFALSIRNSSCHTLSQKPWMLDNWKCQHHVLYAICFNNPLQNYCTTVTLYTELVLKDCQPCLRVTMPLILILVNLKMQFRRTVNRNLPVLQSNLHPKWWTLWEAWIWTKSFAWILQRMGICPKLLQMARTRTESYWPWKNHVAGGGAKDISASSSYWLFVWHFGLWVKLAKTTCYLALSLVW